MISKDARNLFMPVSSDCGLLKTEIRRSSFYRDVDDARIRLCRYGRSSFEDNYTVRKVCCHDEIVFDDESGLFRMKHEAEGAGLEAAVTPSMNSSLTV